MVAPLVLRDEVKGLIELRRGDGQALSDEDVGLVQILAGQAAAALANARLYRAVEEQAIRDGLTGLYNHRHFYERLDASSRGRSATACPSPCSCSTSTTSSSSTTPTATRWGTGCCAVGRLLDDQVRQGIDLVARYGGEEFAVILPNTGRDGACAVGDRLVRQVATLQAAGEDLPPPAHGDGARSVGERIRESIESGDVAGLEGARVTVSVGVGFYPGAAADPEELVRAADKALYLAKRLGKNRVEVFND